MGVILILVMIYVLSENSRYKKKIEELEIELKTCKQELEDAIYSKDDSHFQSRSNIESVVNRVYGAQRQKHDIIDTKNEELNEVIEDSDEIIQKTSRPKKRTKDSRNTAILSIGATFIVVAAMSFLFTNWYHLGNFVKSSVLTILALMFFGMSRIAEKVFKLPQTSKTFYYIALGYVPIVLYSFSLFGILGDYFSIHGDGHYIYLTILSALVAGIYIYLALKNKDKHLFYAGNIMQGLGVIFFTSNFTSNISIILLVLFSYTTIYNYLCRISNNSFFASLCSKLENINLIETLIISLILIFIDDLGVLYRIIAPIVVVINSIDLYSKKKTNAVLPLASTFLLLCTYLNIKLNISGDVLELPKVIKQVLMIFYVLGLSFYCNFVTSKKDIMAIGNFLNTIYMIGLMIWEYNQPIFKSIVAFVMFLIAELIYYKEAKKYNGILVTSLISSYLMCLFEANWLCFIVITLISICSTISMDDDNDKYVKLVPILGFAACLYMYSYKFETSLWFTIISSLSVIATFILMHIKRRDFVYSIAIYIYSLATTTILLFFTQDQISLKVITSMILFAVSCFGYYKSKRNDDGVFAFVNILLYLILGFQTKWPWFIMTTLISIIALIAMDKDNKASLKLIPLLGFATTFYVYCFRTEVGLWIPIITSLFITIALVLFNIKRRDYAYQIATYLYIWSIMGIFVFSARDMIVLKSIVCTILFLVSMAEYYITKREQKELLIATLIPIYLVFVFETSWLCFITVTLISMGTFISTSKGNEKGLSMLPLIGFMMCIHTFNISSYFWFILIASLLVIVTLTMSNIKSKYVPYVFVSFLYLITLFAKCDDMLNYYSTVLLLISWCLSNFLCTTGGIRDLIKLTLHSALLSLYLNILRDLNLNDITALTVGGFLIYAYIVIVSLVKKYFPDNYKILEYIVFALTYISAFEMYTSEGDMAIFIFMIVAFVIASYLMKAGPVFACSLVALIANMFYITRMFWLSIPWWVYLVSVGGILITFAIRNEIAEKKSNIKTLKDNFEKIKEYLDM